MRGNAAMDDLKRYLEERSEGVLRLLEGGKRRGLEELRKGNGHGTRKELFQVVAAAQRAFLELHDRCRTALRYARNEEMRDATLDVQYLLYLFSREVYELAFSTSENGPSVSFPPPEAYSRHYPGSGPEDDASCDLFRRYFGDTVYSSEKSNLQPDVGPDPIRAQRVSQILRVASHA